MKKILAAFAMGSIVTGPCFADIKLTMEERSVVALPGSDGAPSETTSEYTLWLRDDRAARIAPGTRMVARLDLGETYVINDAARSVNVIEMSRLNETLSEPAKVSRPRVVRRIGEWDAERYDLTIEIAGQSATVVLWISSDVEIPMNVYREYAKGLDGGTGMMSSIATLPGYPVLQETDVGIAKSTDRLLSVTEETPPGGTYDIPADYTRN
jgi:hypothetical protein